MKILRLIDWQIRKGICYVLDKVIWSLCKIADFIDPEEFVIEVEDLED